MNAAKFWDLALHRRSGSPEAAQTGAEATHLPSLRHEKLKTVTIPNNMYPELNPKPSKP